MDVAETIYQHAKQLPVDKALEVLEFIAFLETKKLPADPNSINDTLEFLQTLPVTRTRSDAEINQTFQSIRDEWQP